VGAGTSDNHLNFLYMDNFFPSFNRLHQKALSPSLYQAFTLDANRLNAPQGISQYVWSADSQAKDFNVLEFIEVLLYTRYRELSCLSFFLSLLSISLGFKKFNPFNLKVIIDNPCFKRMMFP